MTHITSDTIWIICPCTGDKIKVHGCVLMKCKYECGHEISDNGSYVNCTFTAPIRDIPSSKELIQLATHDFKMREERHHRHDQSSWVSGWITGFLSERKPNWGKKREERVREEKREKIRAALCLHTDEDCVGEMNSDDCLTYEGGCTVCKFDHVVKEKPKFTYEENGNDR